MAYEEQMMKYKAQLEGWGVSVDTELLAKITGKMGLANTGKDAQWFDMDDEGEVKTVLNNYVMDEKDMGLTDAEAGMALIEKVSSFVKAKREKGERTCRGSFYYLLVVHA
jgi:hypothetical protein